MLNRNLIRIVFVIVVVHLPLTLNAQVLEQDSLALVALYDSTNGAGWTNHDNWLSEQPISKWYGIGLKGDRVKWIYLESNNLTGPLPLELYTLDSLTHLTLDRNSIHGIISPQIGNLVKLDHFTIWGNKLTGTIPEVIGNLTALKYLNLGGNDLEGPIPVTIGNLTQLTTLCLYGNQLTGSIPAGIGNLTNLMTLTLWENLLSGSIPPEIENLKALRSLGLCRNHLSGGIPDFIADLINLDYLYLHENALTGTIPDSLGKLTALQTLSLYRNQLSGTIPSSLGNCRELQYMHLYDNQLEGAVPPELARATALKNVQIQNNRLEDLPALDSLVNLQWLIVLNNRFTFEDIEPNVNIAAQYFTYAPQDSVGEGMDTTLSEGAYLELPVTVGGTANLYQWMKDELDIPDATGPVFTISSAKPSDSGVYICKITNSIATNLTLYSRPFRVTVRIPHGMEDDPETAPGMFMLYPNHPNPFNPLTRIRFDLRKAGQVKIVVYDLLGRKIATVLDEHRGAGRYAVDFHAEHLAGGVYFYTLRAGHFRSARKMILMR